jgi:hypothetical protein
MLPLVERIVRDIVTSRQRLDDLAPEQDRLERAKRNLIWPDRLRRYQLRLEIDHLEACFQEALAELGQLGLILIDQTSGEVGFPTKMDGRSAQFLWQLGEQGINYWHFPGEKARRAIPEAVREPAKR